MCVTPVTGTVTFILTHVTLVNKVFDEINVFGVVRVMSIYLQVTSGSLEYPTP